MWFWLSDWGMPFTYLGLPLGTTRPTISDLSPIVCRLETKLTSISSFLSQGARLQLITFALCNNSEIVIHLLLNKVPIFGPR
jgi:hypothetical protein